MTNISEQFQKLMKHKVIDKGFFIPLMLWASGSHTNIDKIQKINRKIQYGKQNIYILELTYNININNFLKYPKILKESPEELQYLKDVCKYYGWTLNELYKNINVIDLEKSKEEIANLFGYEKPLRKKLGIKR